MGAIARHVAAREDEEGCAEKCHRRVARHEDPPPLDAVGDVPGDQRQPHGREELGEPHPREVERPPRDRVDLPPDCDALHLRAEDREHPRALIEAEASVGERRPPRDAPAAF